MKIRGHIFISAGFITALILLLLNDLVLKQAFHNALTGKISDLAGLFIFPLFITALFPGKKRMIFIITAVFFIFWKSPLAQPMIDAWNNITAFHISRTVDYSDYIALLMLPAAWYYKGTRTLPLPLLRIPVILVALFAFCATSYDKTIVVNKTYTLNMPKDVLISRINNIHNGCYKMTYSFRIQDADTMLVGYSDTSWISYTSYTIRKDTIYHYNQITKKETDKIDTIYQYFIPQTDTIFLKDDKTFNVQVPASKYTNTDTAMYCNCVDAVVSISGSGNIAYLTLKKMYFNYCMGASGKKEREKLGQTLTRAFEKEYIDRINY